MTGQAYCKARLLYNRQSWLISVQPKSGGFTIMTPQYALMTQVLEPHHLIILDDWFDFLEIPPAQLVVFTADDSVLRGNLQDLCARHGTRLTDLGTISPKSFRDGEMASLRSQIAAATPQIVCAIRLDVLPYREGHAGWLARALRSQQARTFCYITGTTNPYRADRGIDQQGYRATQRISNNFMMIDKSVWRDMIDAALPDRPDYGRFAVEGNIEYYCGRKNRFGLRLTNGATFRMFHTQVWDLRLLELREDFRAGHKIEDYLGGFEDDRTHKWERYYLWPKDSVLRRFRVNAGRIRQSFLSMPNR
jgi:hypothetical protein